MVAFDPAFYLYLNPGLVAYCNVDVESAASYYASHSNTTLYGPQSMLPAAFDELLYIRDQRETADVSRLNRTIEAAERAAASNRGEDDGCSGCDSRGEYVDNLDVRARLVGLNRFRVLPAGGVGGSNGGVLLGPKRINAGDMLRIRKNRSDTAYARVIAVRDGGANILVSNGFYDFVDQAACYVLRGIRVADARRIAVINYMLAQTDACRTEVVCVDPVFNPELYKLLYPDARELTRYGAFLDYVTRKGQGEKRIRAATDLLTTVDMVIDSPVTFRGARVCSISFDSRRRGREVPDHTSLISERAIKTYVDDKRVFDAPGGPTEFHAEVAFKRDATFQRDACFQGGVRALAIGLGWCGMRAPPEDDEGDCFVVSRRCDDDDGRCGGGCRGARAKGCEPPAPAAYNPYGCGVSDMPDIPQKMPDETEPPPPPQDAAPLDGTVRGDLTVDGSAAVGGSLCVSAALRVRGDVAIERGRRVDCPGGVLAAASVEAASVVAASRLVAASNAEFQGAVEAASSAAFHGPVRVHSCAEFDGHATFNGGLGASAICIGGPPAQPPHCCKGGSGVVAAIDPDDALRRFAAACSCSSGAADVTAAFPEAQTTMDVLVAVLAGLVREREETSATRRPPPSG